MQTPEQKAFKFYDRVAFATLRICVALGFTFLIQARFCNEVLYRKDGLVSLIGLVD